MKQNILNILILSQFFFPQLLFATLPKTSLKYIGLKYILNNASSCEKMNSIQIDVIKNLLLEIDCSKCDEGLVTEITFFCDKNRLKMIVPAELINRLALSVDLEHVNQQLQGGTGSTKNKSRIKQIAKAYDSIFKLSPSISSQIWDRRKKIN